MTSSDTNVDNLVVNQLTRAQYNQLCSQNKIEPDQLYFITDDKTAEEVLDDRLTGYYTKSETNALSTSFRSGLQPAGNYQTKQTTLAGYGITDAKIQNGVITLGSNTITPLTAHQSLAAYAKK